MTGKDYCNCEHAQALREALQEAWHQLALTRTAKERKVDAIIKKALDADHEAFNEYFNNIKGS